MLPGAGGFPEGKAPRENRFARARIRAHLSAPPRQRCRGLVRHGYIHMYIYIYIYRERERGRCIYIYIYRERER